MIVIIIDENDDDSGRPLTEKKIFIIYFPIGSRGRWKVDGPTKTGAS